MEHKHHTVDYLELAVHDVAKAKGFYGKAFGWAFNDYGPEYAGIQKEGGGEVGGLNGTSDAPVGRPLLVLYSRDLEATRVAVVQAGGSIVREIFKFPGGRRFHFKDPSGNECAVWSE